MSVLWIAMGALAADGSDDTIVREPAGASALSGAPEKATWIVRYVEGTPMNTSEFLRAVHAEDRWAEFDRLQRRDLGTGVGLAVGGGVLDLLGLVAVGAGAALASVDDPAGVPVLVGGGVAVLGGVGLTYASVAPWSRRSRRAKDPSSFLSAAEADALIAGHAGSTR